jgi:hypothetical protein
MVGGKYLSSGEDANINEQLALRSKVVWDLSQKTKVTLSLDYFNNQTDVGNTINQVGLNAFGTGRVGSIYDDVLDYEPGSDNNPTHNHSRGYGGGLTIEHDFGAYRSRV